MTLSVLALLTLLTQAMPDPTRTLGVRNPAVTQANIHRTICVPGWTKGVRPPASYTSHLKEQQMHDWQLEGLASDYEEDHLISLELGGDPRDPKNLWPERWTIAVDGVDYGAHTKDRLENALHKKVCADELPLSTAQRLIATDWLTAYRRYVSPTLPPAHRKAHS